MVTTLGDKNSIQKILDNLNFKADDALLKRCQLKGSVMIKDIYDEAGQTMPTTKVADDELWTLAEELIADLYRKRIVSTAESKKAVQLDIDQDLDDIKLHIGIEKGQPISAGEPGVYVGPTVTGLGDSDSGDLSD